MSLQQKLKHTIRVLPDVANNRDLIHDRLFEALHGAAPCLALKGAGVLLLGLKPRPLEFRVSIPMAVGTARGRCRSTAPPP
jgi:hypothetical protein